MRTRPLSNEYPEYYDRYVSLVPDIDIEEILRAQRDDTLTLLSSLPEESSARSYAHGKWTLKEVVGHLTDTERVMAFRMLSIARGESTALPGFDQDSYVASAKFNQLRWAQLQTDFYNVRSATLSLITTMDELAWTRKGTVWNHPVSARAIAYIIAGHERHHLTVIRDRYL